MLVILVSAKRKSVCCSYNVLRLNETILCKYVGLSIKAKNEWKKMETKFVNHLEMFNHHVAF